MLRAALRFSESMNDEFYIGWEDKAPATIGSRVRWAVVLVLMTTFVLGAGLALTQRTIGVSVFEWGKFVSGNQTTSGAERTYCCEGFQRLGSSSGT